jgi:hypothetical protein
MTQISNREVIGDGVVGTRYYIKDVSVSGNETSRPKVFYTLDSYNIPSGETVPKPQYTFDSDSFDGACDVWLTIKQLNNVGAEPIKQIELAHNVNLLSGTFNSSAGKWYDSGDSQSFVNHITGLDLRIHGVTTCSSMTGGVYVTAYGDEWDNGIPISKSGTAPVIEGNYIHSNTLTSLVTNSFAQTITCVPHLLDGSGVINSLAVYAPCLTTQAISGNGIETIAGAEVDFLIDDKYELGSGDIKRIGYQKYYDNPPLGNRYCTSAIWGRAKKST